MFIFIFQKKRRKKGRDLRYPQERNNGQALMEMKGEEGNTTTSAEIDHMTWRVRTSISGANRDMYNTSDGVSTKATRCYTIS